jgi:hypothetical protein
MRRTAGTPGAPSASGATVADWAIANGLACYDCGRGRCICESMDAYAYAEERAAYRTHRLMQAIELAEDKIARLEDENEFHPALPEVRERLANLTRALLTHRRAHHKEAY